MSRFLTATVSVDSTYKGSDLTQVLEIQVKCHTKLADLWTPALLVDLTSISEWFSPHSSLPEDELGLRCQDSSSKFGVVSWVIPSFTELHDLCSASVLLLSDYHMRNAELQSFEMLSLTPLLDRG